MKNETSRTALITSLSDACELEHALSCTYLFSAFSIKTELEEGINWRQAQINRNIASQIYHIAADEMLHLSQAWNILTAAGGTPHIGRPEFPQPAKHFALNKASLVLRRLDLNSINRFIYYESPMSAQLDSEILDSTWAWPTDETWPYSSVGELYTNCKEIIKRIEGEIVIGNPHRQVGKDIIDFQNIIKIFTKNDALNAIDMIIAQGEGIDGLHSDSHWSTFSAIKNLLGNTDSDLISRNVADNPTLNFRSNKIQTIPKMTLEIESTRLLCDLFNDVYISMLQSISFPFLSLDLDQHRKSIAKMSINLMVLVLKPLGEACCLSKANAHSDLFAGPTFQTKRYCLIPNDYKTARIVLADRLMTLHSRSKVLGDNYTGSPLASLRIEKATENLLKISSQLKDL